MSHASTVPSTVEQGSGLDGCYEGTYTEGSAGGTAGSAMSDAQQSI